MNAIFYVTCFTAGMIGIIAQVLFVKLPQLKNSAKIANIRFSATQYFMDDALTFASSVFTVLVAMFIIDEIIKAYPEIASGIKYAFIFIGYTGSSILQHALSNTAKGINSVINVKTDIADGKGQTQ